MARHIVLTPLIHDGESFGIGDVADLSEAVAAGLVAAKVLGPALPDEEEPADPDGTPKGKGKGS